MNRPVDDGPLTRSADTPYRSDFARRNYAAGEARGLANAILKILEHRNIEVSPEERRQILACTCEETLTSWVGRAVTADAAGRLFA